MEEGTGTGGFCEQLEVGYSYKFDWKYSVFQAELFAGGRID